MTTYRTYKTHWTETKRVIDGKVKQVCCCCKAPAATRKECQIATGNKTPCRCFCHSNKHWKNEA